MLAVLFCLVLSPVRGEEPAADDEEAAVAYPLAVAVTEQGAVVVDLDLPGAWRHSLEPGDAPQLLVRGTKRFRTPLNRPRCAAVLPDGALLIGDSATREIYRIEADGSGQPQPLTDGFLGIPMSLAVDAEAEQIYVADLETRFIYRLPLEGGEPEVFSQVSTRGLFLADDGQLWGVTPDENPLVRIDSEGNATAVVEGRKFQFPHNVVVDADGTAYVTDGYAKTVWQVPAGGGEPEPWYQGEPLINPVGLAMIEGALLVADPHAKQLFRIDLETQEITPLF